MNRQEKQIIIDSIKNDFRNNQSSFIVTVQGMTVEAIQGLRKGLHAKGGKLKVAKNTLLKIAASDIPGVTELEPYFKQQIAIVFVDKDTPAVAKLLFEVSKQNEKLQLQAGALSGKVIDKSQIEILATLPPKEVLIAMLAGTLNAPIANLASVLNQLIVKLLWALNEVAQKKK